MGVRMMMKFLYNSKLTKTKPLSHLNNYALLVDGNNLMYQMYANVQKSMSKSSQQQQQQHANPNNQSNIPFGSSSSFCQQSDAVCREIMNTVAEYFIPLKKNNVKVTIVMDGPLPQEKLDCFRLNGMLKSTGTEGKTKKRPRGLFRNLTDDQIFNCRAIFVDAALLLGIKVTYAVGEAEEMCTKLCNMGLGDAVLSKDTDCVAMNCKELILSIERGVVNYTSAEMIRTSLKINSKQLTEMCTLCGNDYNYDDSFKYPKPQEALDLIRSYKCIANIPSQSIPADDQLKVQVCKRIYTCHHDLSAEEESKYQPLDVDASVCHRNSALLTQGLGLKKKNLDCLTKTDTSDTQYNTWRDRPHQIIRWVPYGHTTPTTMPTARTCSK